MQEIHDFYEEFLTSLNSNQVEYLIFGGFAVNMYGFSRVTEDLDVWINPYPTNLHNLKAGILQLGFPDESHLQNFISGESLMLRLSDGPFRVDLLTKLNIRKSFSECYHHAEVVTVPYGKLYFIGYDDLIDEKLRAKRPKDLLDVKQLRIIRGKLK
jgi:hypothetical protein